MMKKTLQKETKTHVLQVNMLGGLSMYYDGTAISFERQYFSKYIQLFLMLILYKEKGIAKEVLQENLYGQKGQTNLNNNLNNMIFRLRKHLLALGLSENDEIVIRNGQCMYVSSGQIQTDVQEFAELVEQARKVGRTGQEDSRQRERDCLLKAVQMYRGELLPKLASETWVIMEGMHYKRLYDEALGRLGQILSQEGSFQELCELYAKAGEMYPLERWHEKQIECLMSMNQNRKAYQVYQETARMYVDELGMPPSQEYISRFRSMGNKLFGYVDSMEAIRQELGEQHRFPGAYCCSLPSFIDSCRLLARLMERNGQSIFLMMCTLVNPDNIPLEENNRTKKKMEWLSEALQTAMRRGDIYTKYSACQYLTLLTGINMEDCSQITARINRRFLEISGSGKQRIRYDITSLMDMTGQAVEKQNHEFSKKGQKTGKSDNFRDS